MDNMSGRKVRCIKSWNRIGLRKGREYTVATRLEALYLSGDSVGLPEGRHSPEGPRGANEIVVPPTGGTVSFKKPQFILKELAFPYLLDADRFEMVG